MAEDDDVLLCRYRLQGDVDAFSEVVRRYFNLVYTAALRQVAGDSGLAEDVSQEVFAALAVRGRNTSPIPLLAGWLHTTTRYKASHAVERERRRRLREQTAHAMETNEALTTPPANLAAIRPLLDEALHHLRDKDREVVLLRYFHEHSFVEIGRRLGLSADAARFRLDRVLSKLADALRKRGIASTALVLGTTFEAEAATVAPTGLAAVVARTSLQMVPATVPGAAITIMTTTKIFVGIAACAAVAALSFWSGKARWARVAPSTIHESSPAESASASQPVNPVPPTPPKPPRPVPVPELKPEIVVAPTPSPETVRTRKAAQPNLVALPQIDLSQALGPNNFYHDDLIGVSLTFPEGWSVPLARRYGTNNHENTVQFTSGGTASTADSNMYYKLYTDPPPDRSTAEAYLRKQAEAKVALRISQGMPDYENVPESFVYTEINGNPALTYFATYTSGNRVVAEYFVRVLGPQGYVAFTTRGNLDDVKPVMPQIQAMAKSVHLP